jgi:hypothetical protein
MDTVPAVTATSVPGATDVPGTTIVHNATLTAPRIGGGSGDTAWVGGSNVTTSRLSRPDSTLARRPTDFKSASSIESKATQGLAEDRRLGLDETTSKITLTSWVNSIRSYMETHGLDTSSLRIRHGQSKVERESHHEQHLARFMGNHRKRGWSRRQWTHDVRGCNLQNSTSHFIRHPLSRRETQEHAPPSGAWAKCRSLRVQGYRTHTTHLRFWQCSKGFDLHCLWLLH